MPNFLPYNCQPDGPFKEGIVLDKPPRYDRQRDVNTMSIRGRYVFGSAHNRRIVVSRAIDAILSSPQSEGGLPWVAPMGFMPPTNPPRVETSTGIVTGSLQVALRKRRSRDSAPSDLTPFQGAAIARVVDEPPPPPPNPDDLPNNAPLTIASDPVRNLGYDAQLTPSVNALAFQTQPPLDADGTPASSNDRLYDSVKMRIKGNEASNDAKVVLKVCRRKYDGLSGYSADSSFDLIRFHSDNTALGQAGLEPGILRDVDITDVDVTKFGIGDGVLVSRRFDLVGPDTYHIFAGRVIGVDVDNDKIRVIGSWFDSTEDVKILTTGGTYEVPDTDPDDKTVYRWNVDPAVTTETVAQSNPFTLTDQTGTDPTNPRVDDVALFTFPTAFALPITDPRAIPGGIIDFGVDLGRVSMDVGGNYFLAVCAVTELDTDAKIGVCGTRVDADGPDHAPNYRIFKNDPPDTDWEEAFAGSDGYIADYLLIQGTGIQPPSAPPVTPEGFINVTNASILCPASVGSGATATGDAVEVERDVLYDVPVDDVTLFHVGDLMWVVPADGDFVKMTGYVESIDPDLGDPPSGTVRFKVNARPSATIIDGDEIMFLSGPSLLARDMRFEDFDTIEMLIYCPAALGATPIVAASVMVVNITPRSAMTFNSAWGDVTGNERAIPFFNRAVGGFRSCIAISDPSSSRWAAVGQPGFDPWRHGELLTQSMVLTCQLIGGRWRIFCDAFAHGASNEDLAEAFNDALVTIYRCDGAPACSYEVPNPDAPDGSTTGSTYFGGAEIARARAEMVFVDPDNLTQVPYVRLRDPNGSLQNFGAVDGPGGPLFRYRIEFRREILAQVTRGSDRVKLFYRGDDNEVGDPAYIADPWMLGHRMSLPGCRGAADVIRVEPLPRRRNSPYVSSNYFPSNELVLAETWKGISGHSTFYLLPDNRSIWFGQSGADNWEGTSDAMRLVLNPPTGIVGLGVCRGKLVAVCAEKRLFVMNVSGIVEPVSLESAFGYSVDQDIRIDEDLSRTEFAFTCVSPHMCNDPAGNLYWQGADARYVFDGTRVKNLDADNQTFEINGYDEASKADVGIALDSSHAFAPQIVFGGFADRGDIRRPFTLHMDALETQLDATQVMRDVSINDFRLRREHVMRFKPSDGTSASTASMGPVEAICSAKLSSGQQVPMWVARGCLFLAAAPAIESGSVVWGDKFTWGQVGDRAFFIKALPAEYLDLLDKLILPAPADEPVPEPPEDPSTFFDLTIRNDDIETFPALAGLEAAVSAGVTVTVIDPNGSWVIGDLLLRKPTEELDDARWTFSVHYRQSESSPGFSPTAEAYDVIFGARPWFLRLPDFAPTPPFLSVTVERFLFVGEEDHRAGESGDFDWPIYILSASSEGDALTRPLHFEVARRSAFGDSRFTMMPGVRSTGAATAIYIGSPCAPPNSNLVINDMRCIIREQMG